MQPISFKMDTGSTVTVYPLANQNECGTKEFYKPLFEQLFSQMPFPGLHAFFELIVWHMDHPQQDILTAQRIPCLQDYDPNSPGNQVAAGLYVGNGKLHIGIFHPNWKPDYAGPIIALTIEMLQAAVKVLSHEFGHFYFDMCRMFKNEDDITRRSGAEFDRRRPHQAANDNRDEDAAEVYAATKGVDEVRGKYSDGKVAVISPELYSLVNCLYWMTGNLKNCWVCSLVPQAGGCMFQVWVGIGWKWRFIGNNYALQEWNGFSWVRI